MLSCYIYIEPKLWPNDQTKNVYLVEEKLFSIAR